MSSIYGDPFSSTSVKKHPGSALEIATHLCMLPGGVREPPNPHFRGYRVGGPSKITKSRFLKKERNNSKKSSILSSISSKKASGALKKKRSKKRELRHQSAELRGRGLGAQPPSKPSPSAVQCTGFRNNVC